MPLKKDLKNNGDLYSLTQPQTIGDIHRVINPLDQVSISIHCYGADIGRVRRHVFDPATGAIKDFVSGYANVARS